MTLTARRERGMVHHFLQWIWWRVRVRMPATASRSILRPRCKEQTACVALTERPEHPTQ